mmetsp:Transcript_1874/g.4760  ORF Transcript_1874/g.4760 Transcript_1874/m.4760 type:complete len:711 (-) Transcript_1874:196-2328(-)
MLRQAPPASATEVSLLGATLRGQHGSLSDAFRAMDDKGVGYLTPKGFTDGIASTGHGFRAEALFRALDRKNFGRLTLQAFVSGFPVDESLDTSTEGLRVRSGMVSTRTQGSSTLSTGSAERKRSTSQATPQAVRSSALQSPRVSIGGQERRLLGASLSTQPALVTRAEGSQKTSGSVGVPAPGREFIGSGTASDGIVNAAVGMQQFAAASREQGAGGRPSFATPGQREDWLRMQRTPDAAHLRRASPDSSAASRMRSAAQVPQEFPGPNYAHSGKSSIDPSVTSLPDDAVPMRLDDRVAALHASLETMLEERVSKLVHTLRNEWTTVLSEEQAKFSLRTAALGQALVKECEGKLQGASTQDIRAEVHAAVQEQLAGITSCFSGEMPRDDVLMSPRSKFQDFRTALLRFEQRIVDRSTTEAQRHCQPLRLEVAALQTRQDRLVQRIAAMDKSNGPEIAGGEGMAITRESLTLLFSDIRDTIQETAKSLREDADRVRRECRDTWLEEAKVRDDGDNIIKKSLEKQLQAVRTDVAQELERQGVLMRSLCKALEDSSPPSKLVQFAAGKSVFSPASSFSTANTHGNPEESLIGNAGGGLVMRRTDSDMEKHLSARGDRQEASIYVPEDRTSGTATPLLNAWGQSPPRPAPSDPMQDSRGSSKDSVGGGKARVGEALNNAEVLSMIEELRKEVSNVRESTAKAKLNSSGEAPTTT